MDVYERRASIINYTLRSQKSSAPRSHPVNLCSAGVPPAVDGEQNWREPVGRRRYFLTKVV